MQNIITLQCLTVQHNCVLLYGKHQSSIHANMKYTFGQRLKMARGHRGITQEQLAEETGIRQSAISRIERNEALTSGYVSRLAKACGVRTDWLAEEDGEMLTDNDIIVCANMIKSLSDQDKAAWLRMGSSLIEQPLQSQEKK